MLLRVFLLGGCVSRRDCSGPRQLSDTGYVVEEVVTNVATFCAWVSGRARRALDANLLKHLRKECTDGTG
jgi:hypothetical protein